MQRVEIGELVSIYRKVKQHVFEQTSCPRLFKIIRFEKSFASNLKRLLATLNDKRVEGEEPFDVVSLCEGVCVMPYRVDNGKRKSKAYKLLAAGRDQLVNSLEINAIYTQLFADIPIVCEIVFALWMTRIGHYIDKKLGNCVLGNRLERRSDGNFPIETPVLYRYYLSDKRRWHEEVSRRARNLLEDGNKISIFASELRNHAVNAQYSSYTIYSDLGIDLLEEDGIVGESVKRNAWLTDLVVKMLTHWRETSAFGEAEIPWGSVIAGLMMNVRLKQFDTKICRMKELNVLHYVRCERMFALILDDREKVDEMKLYAEVHRYVKNCFGMKTASQGKTLHNGALSEKCEEEDDAVFHRSRTRILRLNSDAGRNLLAVFEHALDEDRNVWQNMPEAPDIGDYVRNMYSLFGRVEDEPGLLNLNQPMLSRRRFTKQIQDMEQYLFFLNGDDWEKQRISFLNASKDMLADVGAFALYYPLFPRLLAIAFATAKDTSSPEFVIANQIIGAICKYLDNIPRGIFHFDKDPEKCRRLDRVLKHGFGRCVLERMCATIIIEKGTDASAKKRSDMISKLVHDFPDVFKEIEKEVQPWNAILNADLAWVSFKEFTIARRWHGVADSVGIDSMSDFVPTVTRDALTKVWNQIVAPINKTLAGTLPSALFFATRPLDITDLYTIGNCVDSEVKLADIKEVLRVFNCRMPINKLPILQSWSSIERLDTIKVDYDFQVHGNARTKCGQKVRIALVSWKVDDESWIAMACDECDPQGCDRFKRLMHIVNSILAMDQDKSPHYLIFPELAMPPEVFTRIAKKLAHKGVSLIAGVDYLHCGSSEEGHRLVDNQVWCSLCSSLGKGMPLIYRYEKSEPAIHEALELMSVAKTKYRCDRRPSIKPFVISHGDANLNVCFSVLICSDLRDIKRRALLRVDLLVVPAWNPDVKTYSALVDAAAHDIHAYVALCNSRTYGDTRLRSPAKIEHLRDVVRLRGGRDDFFVIGEIDITKLRRFQSGYNLSHASFKPCPIGFRISEERRALPLPCSENIRCVAGD